MGRLRNDHCRHGTTHDDSLGVPGKPPSIPVAFGAIFLGDGRDFQQIGEILDTLDL